MEKELKYRIVGASVLVFLGVVFIPMILSPSDEMDERFINRVSLSEPEDAFRSHVTPIGESVVEIDPPEVHEQMGTWREASRIQQKVESVPPARTKFPETKPDSSDRRTVLENEVNGKTEFPKTTISSNRWSQNRDKPEKTEDTITHVKQKTPAQRKPVAWAVQVGSFTKSKNALGLRDLLRKKGYPTFVESTKGSDTGATKTRVFVGPVLLRGDALQSAEKLRTDLNVNGIVVRYSGGG